MAKHAAILIRVSTDAQKEHGTSLPQQRTDLLRLAKSLGYTVTATHVYDDGGYSGSQLSHSERPGLGELIKAAERKEFEVIFVQYVDRFGRTTLENLITRNKLKKLGIVIHSYFEGRMENDPAGDLLFMFHSWKAEADNEQRKERSIRGRIAAARNGKHCMGNPPFGYKRDIRIKKLFVVKPLADWVRKFYEWCAVDALSLREICRRANELRVPLPGYRRKHHCWHRSVIHRILRNRAYTGRVIFRRYDKHGKERPMEEWIELSIPPIISRELFEKTQRKLKENRELASRNTKRTYLYGGVLFCGYCQHRLHSGFQPARHQGLGSKYYHGWGGRTDTRLNRCPHCPQVAETRLAPMWEAIKNAVTNEQYLRAKVLEYCSSDTQTVRNRLTQMEQQISTVTLQRKKILNVYVKDQNMDEKEYLRLIQELDGERRQLDEEKKEVEQRLLSESEQLLLSERISQTYERLRMQIVNASYETQRAIIKKIVSRILVYERQGEAEIEFHLAPARRQAEIPCVLSYKTGEPPGGEPGSSFVSRRSSTTGRKLTSRLPGYPTNDEGSEDGLEAGSVRIKVPIYPARAKKAEGLAAAA